ncbi:hypothetical protein [Streptomyces sp. NPDC054765]
MVVPIVGWQSLPKGAQCSIGTSPLEPVVLFDNVREPILSPLIDTLTSWDDGSYVHQVLEPGAMVRELPEGWKLTEYRG